MPPTDRVIRVFISSTFRDMMRERDLLVKRVFPELRHKCAKRFVTFTEVDLRWGITEEQAAEGKVLPLCLAEIERSRPYFIGLLGERYGWVPEAVPDELLESEPWLQEQLQGRKSVTELEKLLESRQAAVSQQLSRLRLEGLIVPRRDGKTIYYSLADVRARKLIETMYELFCADEESTC